MERPSPLDIRVSSPLLQVLQLYSTVSFTTWAFLPLPASPGKDANITIQLLFPQLMLHLVYVDILFCIYFIIYSIYFAIIIEYFSKFPLILLLYMRCTIIFLKILFIYLWREGKGCRKRGRHQCVVASCETPTGDLTYTPTMCPDWELNWQSFGLQVSTQSTEPHQPG